MSTPYALIVEPHSRRSNLYQSALADESLDPALATSNLDARGILKQRGAPTLVLVELTNAAVDGFRLLAELREQFPGQRVPAVVVSAFGALRDTAWNLRQTLNIEAVLATDLPESAVRLSIRRALGRAAPGNDPQPDNRPDPHRERIRLAKLRDTGLADAPTPTEALARLVGAVVHAFDVEAALCSVLTVDRELILAHEGLTGRLLTERGTPREHSIARHVVESIGNEALVIEDALSHPTFGANPLVREGIVRGFVGVPLLTTDGTKIGALCVIDTRPLSLSAAAIETLHQVASRVSGELDMHSERRRPPSAAAEAKYALHHFSAILSHLDQPVALFGPQGRIRLANPALSALLSVFDDRLLGMDRAGLAAALQAASADSAFTQMVAKLPAEPLVRHEEVRFDATVERVFFWSTKPVDLPDGEGQLDVWRDITAERELERAALTDPLTTLANRRGGEEALKREVARCRRINQTLSFLMCDIDNFKRVNDSQGHAAGDRVIRGVARIIARQLRSTDLAIRWGGEEFFCILPGADIAEARRIAERIRAAVGATTFDVGDITISIGCAQLDASMDATGTLAMADARLYEAKAAGRNTVR